MKKNILTLFCLFSLFQTFAQQHFTPEFAKKQYREFDFWIGAWDVNLRVQQEDASWEDQIKSEAHIYPILDGKAILELWNETSRDQGIKGFSLRYFREDIDQWELWLNWPGPNRSGTSSLTGEFRHGRGEFFSTNMINDSTELLSRYTFCDITKNSLRWDDAYSRDGGKTWSNQWIMEFSRRQQHPPQVRPGRNLNTFDKGERCTLAGFEILKKWTGRFSGEVEYLDGEQWRKSAASLQGYPILEGCAVIHFLAFERPDGTFKSFGFHTFNTYNNKLEYDYLDNQPGSLFETFFGEELDGKVAMDGYDLRANAPVDQRIEWTFGDNGRLSFEVFEKGNGKWTAVSRGRLRRL